MGLFNWINGQAGGTPLSAENLNQMQVMLLDTIFPVGSTYVTQTNTNPATILGVGTWQRFKGKFALGLDENEVDFNAIGKTGGNKTSQQLESADTTYGLASGSSYYADRTIIKDASVPGTGERNAEVSLMNPFEVTGYMWIRRA